MEERVFSPDRFKKVADELANEPPPGSRGCRHWNRWRRIGGAGSRCHCDLDPADTRRYRWSEGSSGPLSRFESVLERVVVQHVEYDHHSEYCSFALVDERVLRDEQSYQWTAFSWTASETLSQESSEM